MPPKAAKEEPPVAEEEIVFERTEYEEQCDQIFKELDRAFKKLHKTSKPEKLHAQIKDITGKLKQAKALIKDFEREARADGMPASELAARKKVMASELNGFIAMKNEFAQAEGNKGDLLSGAQPAESDLRLEAMSMQQLMSKGRKDIDDINQTINRAQRIAEDTKQVGTALGQTLADQTKKMEGIVNDLNEIEFTMKKASQIIRDITRGLLTDKCIAFLLLLVVLGVVAIIVLKIINPNKKKVQEGASAVISNVTDAAGSIIGKGSPPPAGAARRMLMQKALLHVLELNATL
ncbi:hypothetical protein Vretimale_9586 [Volvox reticuliferus]|uniref:Uncharacterized protein n=1 Tax=Volvox reticuliferus TaxID=1737510 RepID=A0A8J4GE89_9CHLO|nr:hypothetical protein Vretifemale_19261 [Volvox reticuliferus]GIM05141.1 hypothetical protein Vretimale_9586 [Volvox reticuliferus]